MGALHAHGFVHIIWLSGSFHLQLPSQVKTLHELMVANPDTVNMYVDHWGCKRLCSLAVRRYRAKILFFKDCMVLTLQKMHA